MKPILSMRAWASLAIGVLMLQGASAIALIGPPEEDIARRAEQAAERAQKAAERAAEAAQRAAERAERDRGDMMRREADAGLRAQRDADKAAEDLARESARREEDAREASLKASEEAARSATSGSSEGGSSSDGLQVASSSGTSGSSSGSGTSSSSSSGSSSTSGSSGSSGDGSSSTSGSSGTSGDGSSSNSGSGSSGSGDDDDDDGDSDDDQQGTLQAGRGAGLESDEFGSPFRANELVILADDAGIVERARTLGFTVLDSTRLAAVGSVVVRMRRPDGVSSAQALQMLRTNEPEAASGYNYVYDMSGPPLPDQTTTRAGAKLKLAPSGQIVVGVVDGFKADTLSGWKVERLVANPARTAHGDAVAGILLDDLNTFDAPLKKMLLIDVVSGKGQADVAALIMALDGLVSQKATYANVSLAGPDHPALKLAVERSLVSGLTIVAAVGNAGPAASPAFPAAYEGVVGVSAVDRMGRPYIYSGRGSQVDVAAPGVDEMVAGNPELLSGTSYAAPHVTAFLAARRPPTDRAPVERFLVTAIQDVGPPGRDPVYGLGILDPGHSLAAAASGARLAAASTKAPH